MNPASKQVPVAPDNQSVIMSVRLLDALAASRTPLGVTELARRVGEQKARVHRHLATLRSCGLVNQDDAGERYRLGWKILQLGIAAAENLDLRVLAKRHLVGLRDACEQTVVLAIPAGGDALAVDCEPSNAQVTTVVKNGVIFQASTSSLGRTLLAFASPALQDVIKNRPMTRYTEFSLCDPSALQERLELIQDRFYEIAVNENIYGVSALSAPIFDQRNQIVAAIGIVGSQFHIAHDPPFEIISHVQHAASAISADLNSTAWTAWRGHSAVPGPSR